MKRFFAWLLCIVMLFSVGAFAETAETTEPAETAETAEVLETPIAVLDNEQLFLQSMMQDLMGLDPTSQKVTMLAEVPSGEQTASYGAVAAPTSKGIALDVLMNGESLGRVEVGQEKIWVSYMGMVYELAYSEIMKLAQMFMAPAGAQDALAEALAPYMGKIMGWVSRAGQLLSPMVRVTGLDGSGMHIHVNLEARQLINVLVTLGDEIIGDQETMTGILDAVMQYVPAEMLGGIQINYETLSTVWKSIRQQMVYTRVNASLSLDATVAQQGLDTSLSANGTLNVDGKQMFVSLDGQMNSRVGTFSAKGNVSGSLLDGGRMEFSMERALQNPNTTVRISSAIYTISGKVDVYMRGEHISMVLDGTSDSTGAKATTKVFVNDELQSTLDESVRFTGEALEIRVSQVAEYGSNVEMRLYADAGLIDASLVTEYETVALNVVLDEGPEVSYCRFYNTSTYGGFVEVIYENNTVTYRDGESEIVIAITYPDDAHMLLTMTGSTSYGGELSLPSGMVELKKGEDGELWSWNGILYDGEGNILFMSKVSAENAEPAASLDDSANKLVITADMIMQLVMQAVTSQMQSMPVPAPVEETTAPAA